MKPVLYHQLSPRMKKEVREAYIKEQDGRCMYCKEDLTRPAAAAVLSKSLDMRRFPPQFLAHPVHLQHDHATGLTEGAVHAYCNGVMFQYEGR